MYNQFSTSQAVKLLESTPDNSYANKHARDAARQYLRGWINNLIDFSECKPGNENARQHLIKIIDYYQSVLDSRKD